MTTLCLAALEGYSGKPDAVKEGEIQEGYQLQRGRTTQVGLSPEASGGDSDGNGEEPA